MSDLDRWHDQWKRRHGTPMVLATHPDTDDLHRWERGVWHNITPRFGRILMQETSASLTEHAVKTALFQATNLAPYLDGERHGLDGEAPWINFRNGVYDLDSGELLPHGEPWNTTTQIPHDYLEVEDLDLEAMTLPLDTYMRERVAEDTAEAGVLWQLLGSAMLPGNPGQVFVILSGPAGSGKSTYLGIVLDVIGNENAANLTLSQLREKFTAAFLQGTLANIAGDVNGGVVPAYELILGITGGDLITADRKHRNPIAFTWEGLLILATNGRLILPSGAGSEAGWWRRALYVDMPHAVAAGERVSARKFREDIAPDLDAVATRAARELRAAWQEGNVPTVTASMLKSSAAARTSGDTVTDWTEDRLLPHPEGQVLGKDAFRDYAEWCEFYNREPRGGRAFYEDLDSVLTRRGWGGRSEGRSEASRAMFSGITLDSRKVWSLTF